MILKFIAPTFISLLVFTSTLHAQTQANESNKVAKKTEVMVLGTFHFNQIEPKDEMLSEKRQAEIAELLECLKEFNPDKIFIERNPEFEYTNKIGERYQAYLRGEFDLKANEIYQIGFRLAKELEHEDVFQADHPGRYGSFNTKVRAYAKAHGQEGILEGTAPATTLGLYETQDTEALRKNSTLIEYLHFLNGPDYQRADHGWYASTLPRIGDTKALTSENDEKDFENEYFIGAEMLADWYRRNIKIYSKILTQLNFEEERILVVFGAGHNATLKHLLGSNPHFVVVDTAEFLKRRKLNNSK